MKNYSICIYGNPVLRIKAKPVSYVDKGIRKLADEMVKVMFEKKGVGLAAQQIGELARIFVMHVPPEYDVLEKGGERLNPEIKTPLAMINHVIVEHSGSYIDTEECLSVPEIWAEVKRAFEIKVNFLDLDGKKQQVTLKGLMARVVQHELDHLDGVLFVDRLPTIKKMLLKEKLIELQEKVSQAKK